jgi:putative phosphoribosyl transferase
MPVIFKTRTEAGEKLAREVIKLKPASPIVLGIPRGGVPVGEPVARALGCALDVVVLRKIPIPWSPEAGYGAVTLDRTVVLNEKMLSHIRLGSAEIEAGISEVYREVLRRERAYRGDRPFPDLKGRTAVLVDDGLASGYTMLAAVKFVRARGAASVVVASPVASESAYELIRPETDELVVLHVDYAAQFAVASFYEEFPDMRDEEVIAVLRRYA